MEKIFYTCPMHPEVIKPEPGKCPKCGMDLVPVSENKDTGHAAMDHPENNHASHTGMKQTGTAATEHHHNIHGSNPPMGHAGHDHHAMMIADFKKRFYVVLLLTVPVIAVSEMIQNWLNFQIYFPGL